jgi:hypothetical protein
VKASPQQMRAAIECLPFEEPKLSAMAVTAMDPNSFATRQQLDRIDRHMAALRQRIYRQLELVEKEKSKGRNAERALKLLETLNDLMAYGLHSFGCCRISTNIFRTSRADATAIEDVQAMNTAPSLEMVE